MNIPQILAALEMAYDRFTEQPGAAAQITSTKNFPDKVRAIASALHDLDLGPEINSLTTDVRHARNVIGQRRAAMKLVDALAQPIKPHAEKDAASVLRSVGFNPEPSNPSGASGASTQSFKTLEQYETLLNSDPRGAGEFYARNRDAIGDEQGARSRANSRKPKAGLAPSTQALDAFQTYQELLKTDSRAAGEYYFKNANAIGEGQAAFNRAAQLKQF